MIATHPLRRWESEHTRLTAFVAIVIGAASVVALGLRMSGFTATDFISMHFARRQGLSVGFLTADSFDHFVPGHRFVNWALQTVAPLNFRVATAFLLVVFVATLLVVHRLLAELFRPGPGPLLLTLFFGFSAIQVGTAQWWAAGMSRLTANLFVAVALLTHLRYLRTGRRRVLALSVAAVGFGAMFSEGAALVIVHLLGLHVLVLDRGRPVRDSIRAAAARWRMWALYLLPIVPPLVAVAVRSGSDGPLASAESVGAYLGAGWLRAYVPSVFGQFVNVGPLTTAEVVVVVLCQLALIAVVWATATRRRDALRSWLLVPMAFLTTQVPVAIARTGGIPAEILAHQYRYFSEVLLITTIALGATVLAPAWLNAAPARGAIAGARAGPRAWRAPAPWTGVALVLAAALYIASSGWMSMRIADKFGGRLAGPYLAELRDSIRGEQRRVGLITMLDGLVPDFMIGPAFVGYNRFSLIVALFDPSVNFTPANGPVYRFRADGDLERLDYRFRAGGRAIDLLESKRLAVSPAETIEVQSGHMCLRTGASAGALLFPQPAPITATELVLRFTFDVDSTGTAYVFADNGNGKGSVPTPDPLLLLDKDRSQMVMNLGPGPLTSLLIILPVDQRTCVGDIEIGSVEALS